MAKNERRISETDTLDIVLRRLAGETLETVAKSMVCQSKRFSIMRPRS